MLKIRFFIIISIILILLALWSPWYSWNISIFNIFGINNPDKYAGLKVKSLEGEIEIYIDEKLEGSVTDNEDFAEIYSIKPGIHTVKLKNTSQENYFEFQKNIEFYENTEVVIAYELGPNQYFSEGHILYATKNYISGDETKLDIYSLPDMTKVYLDGIFIGETPLNGVDLSLDEQHKLKFEKVGYNTLEFTVLPDTKEDRLKLKGKNLILEVKLFLKPVMVVER